MKFWEIGSSQLYMILFQYRKFYFRPYLRVRVQLDCLRESVRLAYPSILVSSKVSESKRPFLVRFLRWNRCGWGTSSIESRHCKLSNRRQVLNTRRLSETELSSWMLDLGDHINFPFLHSGAPQFFQSKSNSIRSGAHWVLHVHNASTEYICKIWNQIWALDF